MTELFLAELEREADRTRRTLERLPEGQNEWKPHEKSMPLGYLATLCALIPSWVTATIKQDELDLDPPGGPAYRPPEWKSATELLDLLEKHVADGRAALEQTTDEHLMTRWRLLFGGQQVGEWPRHIVLRDSVFNHLAHHRGQLTVYLRMHGKTVPAIYGPSADERSF